MTLILDGSRVWRRDSKVQHRMVGGFITGVQSCSVCGLFETAIKAERLGCIAALHPQQPKPPKPKRRDGRCWKRGRR